MNGQQVSHVFPEIVQIGLVVTGNDDLVDAGADGSQELLFDAADRKHATGQRQLTGHRDVSTDLPSRESRHQCRGYRNSGGGTILGNGPGRHVDVNVPALERILRDCEASVVALGKAQCGPPGLLHDVT